jgi:hypothetical protein
MTPNIPIPSISRLVAIGRLMNPSEKFTVLLVGDSSPRKVTVYTSFFFEISTLDQ